MVKKIVKYGFYVILVCAMFICFDVTKAYGKEISKDNRYNLDEEILSALDVAHEAAYEYVSFELHRWVGELDCRADEFVDDYYKYWNVKKRSIKAFMLSSEKMQAEIEKEINSRIIMPELSQKVLEEITNGAIDVYLSTLDEGLRNINVKYKVPKQKWNKYISSLSGITYDVDMRNNSLAGKGVFLSKAGLAVPVLGNIMFKAFRGVTKNKKPRTLVVPCTFAGMGLGGAALIGGDYVYYFCTSKKEKAELKGDFHEFFQQMRIELMDESSNDSIMGAITKWENKFKAKIARKDKKRFFVI